METDQKDLLASVVNQEILNDEIEEPPVDVVGEASSEATENVANEDGEWWNADGIHKEVKDYCRFGGKAKERFELSNCLCNSCPCARWIGSSGLSASFGCFCTELSQMIIMFVGENPQRLGLPTPTQFCGLREVYKLQSEV